MRALKILSIALGALLLSAAAYVGYEALRLTAFYKVRVGMAESEVRSLLGNPTIKRPAGACLEEEGCGTSGPCWLYRQRLFEHLLIRFDASGHVACRDIYRPEVRQSQ